MILFEEFGGNPSKINFQTIKVGSVSGSGNEGDIIELSCHDEPISAIKFASFGDPRRTSESFVKGSCEGSNDASSIIQKVIKLINFLMLY